MAAEPPAGAPPPPAADRPPRRFVTVLATGCLLWGLFLVHVSWQRWQAGDIGIDTAAWAQSLHEQQAGRGFVFTCYPDVEATVPRSQFSVHFYLHLLGQAVVYRLLPHPLVLYVLQHLAHVLGAFCLGLFAWHLAQGDEVFALGLAAAFLLYAPLARAQVAYDVNPRHTAMLLLPLAGWARCTRRWGLLAAAALALAAGEENLALLAGFTLLGVAWVVPAQRRWTLVLGTVLLAYTALVLRFGLAAFMREGFHIHFLGRYTQLTQGLAGWQASLWRPENGRYLLELLAPLALLPLLTCGPWHVAALPFLAQNLLSAMLDTRLIGHHYTSPLAVALFLTVVEGFARHRWRRLVAIGLLGLNLALAIVWYPVLGYLWEGLDARVVELGRNMAPLAAVIGPDDALCAPPAVCARFWARPRLWFLPHGLETADVVVVPCYEPGYPALTAADLQQALARLRADPRCDLVAHNDDFLVFRRRLAGQAPRGAQPPREGAAMAPPASGRA